MMKLPVNSENFKEIVLEKIRTYCDTNIWPFEYDYFAAWLNNFDCPIEEYLALQMLDNLIVLSISSAIQTTAFLWAVLVVPTVGLNYLYNPNLSKELFLIDAGHHLLSMMVMAAVIMLMS